MRQAMAAAAVLAGCATPPGERSGADLGSGLTPQQIVAARQAAYHLSGAAMGHMNAAIERGGDIAAQAYAARGVARWARALPTLFPDSTRGVGPTRARPEIWASRADFEAKAAAYADAATQLAAVAESGDRDAFAAQFRATVATCRACHDHYQAPLRPAG